MNDNLRFGFLKIRGNWVQGFGKFCRNWGFHIGVWNMGLTVRLWPIERLASMESGQDMFGWMGNGFNEVREVWKQWYVGQLMC